MLKPCFLRMLLLNSAACLEKSYLMVAFFGVGLTEFTSHLIFCIMLNLSPFSNRMGMGEEIVVGDPEMCVGLGIECPGMCIGLVTIDPEMCIGFGNL